MRKLSIIIPVLGRLEQQENSLISVLQNRPNDTEIIVVLNRPYDDPYELSGEVRFLEARRRAGLIECLNLGIRESQSPLLHLLACGVETTEGWTTSAVRHFRDPQVAAVAPLVLSREEPRQIVAAGLGMSRGGSLKQMGQGRGEGSLGPWASQMIGPGLFAGFYRKAAIEAAGGLDASLGTGAAVELATRLRAMGQRVLLDPQSKMFADLEIDFLERGFGAGLKLERLFLRRVPEGRWLGSLAAHSLVLASDLLGAQGLRQLLGRILAWTSLNAQRKRYRELADAIAIAGQTASVSSPRCVPAPHIPLAPTRVLRDAA